MDYTTIYRPYDSNLNRQDYLVGGIDSASPAIVTMPGQSDNRVLSDRNFDDLWINKSIKSRGFKPQAAGFWLDGRTGDAQFNNLVLVGGIIRFRKTSFNDSVHAGYFIGPDGIYFGSAGDASYLKFDTNSGVLTVVGTFQTDTTGSRIVLDHDTNRMSVYNDSDVVTVAIGGNTDGLVSVKNFAGDTLPALYVEGRTNLAPAAYFSTAPGITENTIQVENGGTFPAVDIANINTSSTAPTLLLQNVHFISNSLKMQSLGGFLNFWLRGGSPAASPVLTAEHTGDVVFSTNGRIYVSQGGTSWGTVAFLSDIPP